MIYTNREWWLISFKHFLFVLKLHPFILIFVSNLKVNLLNAREINLKFICLIGKMRLLLNKS